MDSATISTLTAPNLWILTSATKSESTGIMLICLDEAPRFIKTQTPIHILHLPPAYGTTSQHFHLPSHYENHQLTINISLNTAKLNVMNVSSPEFRIWQHLEDHWNRTQATWLGQHTLSSYWSTLQVHDQQQWTHHSICFSQWVKKWYSISLDIIFSYRNLCNGYRITDTHGLEIFCCYFFWHQPAILMCQPLWSGSSQHTIVDDVEGSTCLQMWWHSWTGMVIRPHENRDLQMKWEPTWMEIQQKQQA